MTLDEMFTDQDVRSFEERRDEVVAIVSAATDFAGADRGLRSFFETMCRASDERQFEGAFEALVSSIGSISLAA